MLVRTAAGGALIALLGLAPASAQSVTPSQVLGAKTAHKSAHGFADRTARIASIMGPEMSRGRTMNVPTRPAWKPSVRREADAGKGLR